MRQKKKQGNVCFNHDLFITRHIFAIRRLLLACHGCETRYCLPPPKKPQIQCFVICFFFCELLQHFSYLLVFSKVTALSRPPWITSSFDSFYYKCLNQTFLHIRNECELTESIAITNKARTSIPASMMLEKCPGEVIYPLLLMLSSASNTI